MMKTNILTEGRDTKLCLVLDISIVNRKILFRYCSGSKLLQLVQDKYVNLEAFCTHVCFKLFLQQVFEVLSSCS